MPAGQLLSLYDNLSAHNACAAFITQALASALVTGGLDDRAATGAVFCAQWLNDRAAELEQQLKNMLVPARVAGGAGVGRKR